MKTRKEKSEDPLIAVRTEQTRLIRSLLHGFVDNSGKRTKPFEVLVGDQELLVRTATYGPEIDQSQHVKSVSHKITDLCRKRNASEGSYFTFHVYSSLITKKPTGECSIKYCIVCNSYQ